MSYQVSYHYQPAVSDGTDADEEDGCCHELVHDAAQEGEVGGGEGGEDPGRVGQTAVLAPVVLVPDQRVPVGEEHHQGGRQGAQVLSSHVVGNLQGTSISIITNNLVLPSTRVFSPVRLWPQ